MKRNALSWASPRSYSGIWNMSSFDSVAHHDCNHTSVKFLVMCRPSWDERLVISALKKLFGNNNQACEQASKIWNWLQVHRHRNPCNTVLRAGKPITAMGLCWGVALNLGLEGVRFTGEESEGLKHFKWRAAEVQSQEQVRCSQAPAVWGFGSLLYSHMEKPSCGYLAIVI
jgi:hypothetical protein